MPLYSAAPTFGTITLAGNPAFIFGTTAVSQLTVAATGVSTASALPIFPAAYARVQNATGASLVFPLYASS